jgi:hypothetical protein
MGEGRMPWVSAAHPFGDTSALTRFVIGLDEALRDYHGSDESPLPRNAGRPRDPWDEDLFYRHLPVAPRDSGQEKDSSIKAGSTQVAPPDARLEGRATRVRFQDEHFDKLGARSSPGASQFVARFMALAGLFAGLLRVPAMRRQVSPGIEKPEASVRAKAAHTGEKRAYLPSSEPN